MSNDILSLEPKIMWKYFHEITQVPRPSKKEEQIRQYLVEFGKEFNLETIVDEVGNVLINKAGTHGMEDHKTVILQSHMDMVCEKNSDIDFDFTKDPIKTRIEGEWVKATGTTLGADDGIGMAAALAILASDEIAHPPIESLFTMDEETGLTGAFGLSNDLLKGRILLNLDSEDEGQIFIGCAGGRDTTAELKVNYVDVHNKKSYKLEVKGLNGGHSGDDINKGYANANKLINRILAEAIDTLDIDINYYDGGNLRNAIAREAYANIFVEADKYEQFAKLVSKYENIFKQEYHKTELNITTSISEIDIEAKAIAKDDCQKVINAVYACPHGVLAMSQDIKDFVETSTNLASIKTKSKSGRVIFTTSQRSSVGSALDDACNMVAANFNMIGAKVEHSSGYPGWTPNPNSEILEISKESYISLFKNEPQVLAIHAGLECGLIGEKYPGMDMVSFGPTIKGAHSPDERIEIKTAQMFWEHLIDILKRIPKN
jgi:dipeptidase D